MDEARDWEGCYVRGETPWDKGTPAPPLVEYLARETVRGRVLVPGCGLGHDARALAAQGAEVVGLDVSPTAVQLARERDPVAGEKYASGDFFALEDSYCGAFDWVFEHTCFCAIEPERRADYVAAVRRVLAPGGRLLAIFYIDPYDEDHEPGGGPPHGCAEEIIRELFAEGFECVDSWVPDAAYPGREGREWMVVFRVRSLND